MQVLYTDGDEEILNLKKERWEYIDDDSGSERVGGCVNVCFACHLRFSNLRFNCLTTGGNSRSSEIRICSRDVCTADYISFQY